MPFNRNVLKKEMDHQEKNPETIERPIEGRKDKPKSPGEIFLVLLELEKELSSMETSVFINGGKIMQVSKEILPFSQKLDDLKKEVERTVQDSYRKGKDLKLKYEDMSERLSEERAKGRFELDFARFRSEKDKIYQIQTRLEDMEDRLNEILRADLV